MTEVIKDHAIYVKATVNSVLGQTLADPISRSWRRCIQEYGLDPADMPDVAIVPASDLQERQEHLADLLAISRSELRNLYEQIAGSGFAVMIADSDAVILDYIADLELVDSFSKLGLVIGGNWDEHSQGTNAIGACLFEKEPLVVHQSDHFVARNIELTCSSAPICDYKGHVVAVLNAAGRSEVAQRHTLALVNTSARMIENSFFLNCFKNSAIVRFHNRAEFIGGIREAEIALADDGIILGGNRNAISQLEYGNCEDLVGKAFDEVFKSTHEELVDRGAGQLNGFVPIYDALRNRRYFATMKLPRPISPSKDDIKSTCAKRKQASTSHDPVARELLLDELALGDARMAMNVRYVKSVRDRQIPILIQGETGTGKEVMARAIHASRDGDRRPIVVVNCAAIPETLIESELFGYARGAFTGASREGQKGKILIADKGTLFLDEIGDMPLQLQSRLLRVLEQREVQPLGAEKSISVDIALISATNRDLRELVAAGRFRSDLYFRLQGLMLTLPPLRERSDKCSLIEHIIELESQRYHVLEGRRKSAVAIDDCAFDILEQYHWPGNIRQLRTVIRVAFAMCGGSTITSHFLPEEIKAPTETLVHPSETAMLKNVAPIDIAAESMCDEAIDPSVALNVVEEAERGALLKELAKHHWNIAHTARDLRVSRLTFYRKMKRLGIRK
ncbi:MAG: sigma-54-dependent Fis family transcriptional regulator [Beijerinckiaceae bacterium]|nr:MAG: sigma-54-dependent Fis family transcriptional regulator [Beijerinckiaceae bacterium]